MTIWGGDIEGALRCCGVTLGFDSNVRITPFPAFAGEMFVGRFSCCWSDRTSTNVDCSPGTSDEAMIACYTRGRKQRHWCTWDLVDIVHEPVAHDNGGLFDNRIAFVKAFTWSEES